MEPSQSSSLGPNHQGPVSKATCPAIYGALQLLDALLTWHEQRIPPGVPDPRELAEAAKRRAILAVALTEAVRIEEGADMQRRWRIQIADLKTRLATVTDIVYDLARQSKCAVQHAARIMDGH